MFGMFFRAQVRNDLCLDAAAYAADATPGKKICSTYSNYVNYADASLD